MLQRESGAQVDRGCESLLVERSRTDADQSGQQGEIRADAGAVAPQFVADDETDAGEAERDADPLHESDGFADQAAEQRRYDRHGADDERGESRTRAERDAEIDAGELQRQRQETGDQAVPGFPP